MYRFFVGFLIVVAGLAGYASGAFVSPATEFHHVFPESDSWGADGSHNNTLTNEEGGLVIDDTVEELGVFTSDTFLEGNGDLEIERIVVSADSIQSSQDEVITIEFQGFENDAVTVSREYIINESGTASISLQGFEEMRLESYRFVAALEGGDSPVLEEVSVQGRTYQEDDLISLGFMLFFLFFGVALMLVDVTGGRD